MPERTVTRSVIARLSFPVDAESLAALPEKVAALAAEYAEGRPYTVEPLTASGIEGDEPGHVVRWKTHVYMRFLDVSPDAL